MGGGRSYPSAEVQSVYFTAPADWAILLGKSKGFKLAFHSYLHYIENLDDKKKRKYCR